MSQHAVLCALVLVVLSNRTAMAQSEPAWSESMDGLQYRLRAAQSASWQSWQRPNVILDVRNATAELISESVLSAKMLGGDRGPFLLQQPLANLEQVRRYDWKVDVEFDRALITDLPSDATLSIPLTITGVDQSSTGGNEKGLRPDQFSVGIGRLLPRQEPEFFTPLLPIQILVPGASTPQELESFLDTYRIGNQAIAAGFVPRESRFVDGQQITITFVVYNRSERPYVFTFGGDYRGVQRHNRFQVEVRDADGNLLDDPIKHGGDFGGLNWPQVVLAGRMTTEPLDISNYRTLPGPGKYKVTLSFELLDEFDFSGAGEDSPKQLVQAELDLEILPRTDDNVARVLDGLVARCKQTSGPPLEETIGEIASFGKAAAVARLAELARDPSASIQHAALRGLSAIDDPAALEVLLGVEGEGEIRVVAIGALGKFSDRRAAQRAIDALSDSSAAVRSAAIAALGQMKLDMATEALLKQFRRATTEKATSEILTALGVSGSKAAFEVIVQSLGDQNTGIRRAAVDAIVGFDPAASGEALRQYVEDPDLDFREYVVRMIAEKLRQPIEADWLVPVIRSRNGNNTIGDAPRLMRIYTNDRAAPALLSTLDFENPAVRNYYNMVIVQNQLSCRTGLAIPWIGDLNRNGTKQELEHNRGILRRIARWLDEYQRQPWQEPPEPWRLPHDESEKTWGEEVDGVRLRARTNSSVWPQGLPQVLIIELISSGGTIIFGRPPEITEIEVDGDWYAHDRSVEMKVVGDWHAYKGHRYHSFQLTDSWKRIDDGQPLTLEAGEHTARIRVTPPGSDAREKMVTSKLVEFRVLR